MQNVSIVYYGDTTVDHLLQVISQFTFFPFL